MSISVRTRFEVFKRDRFTCSYCGRTPPEVLLEADHIIPKAAGGSDDLANLTTACATCNRGKAARLLEEGTGPVVGRATVEELAERVEQAKAYMEALGGLQALADSQYQMVITEWAKAFGAVLKEEADGSFWRFPHSYVRGEVWPNEASVRRFLRHLTLEDLLEAVVITSARMNNKPQAGMTNYFYGVCNRSIREGRSVGNLPVRQPETPDRWKEGYSEGYQVGYMESRKATLDSVRDCLVNHVDNGYETAEEAVRAIWPDDE